MYLEDLKVHANGRGRTATDGAIPPKYDVQERLSIRSGRILAVRRHPNWCGDLCVNVLRSRDFHPCIGLARPHDSNVERICQIL